ncbi:LysR family transcriptional regulator [Polynucleobacter sp. MWH-HuK1]|uniref:LysR family transcriptional regulator n=1 Tax=Polynucleobacter sp. MWH-HuK1 TaxID=1743158 RepID=UPI001C0C809A|nr:LysR family transcriptional regulator [Polynucleobacter sp. MWH-HuK1]MBU3565886.1 LysR family transcriptional regulator [Polynucleobacter sp. MWH-HuK1]
MNAKKTVQNWDDLRYFLAVVRAKTLSGAGEQLGTEHTTVARHIRALEERLKTRLFLKSNSGYDLTPAGEKILNIAETVESALLTAEDVTTTRKQDISGTVRLGSPDGLCTVFIAPRLKMLSAEYPNLHVEIISSTRIYSLTKREADIYIGFSRPDYARVVSRRLTDYKLFVYGSKEYLKTAAKIMSKNDVSKHPFIGYVEEFIFFPELNYLDMAGTDLIPHLSSTNLMTQVFAALGGVGLCILPSFLAESFPDLVAVLPDQLSINRSFYMNIHEDHRNAQHIRAVADFIASEIEKNESLFLKIPN